MTRAQANKAIQVTMQYGRISSSRTIKFGGGFKTAIGAVLGVDIQSMRDVAKILLLDDAKQTFSTRTNCYREVEEYLGVEKMKVEEWEDELHDGKMKTKKIGVLDQFKLK